MPRRDALAALTLAALLGGCVLPGLGVGVDIGPDGAGEDTGVREWDVGLGGDVGPVQASAVELAYELSRNATSVVVELQLSTAAAIGLRFHLEPDCAWSAPSPSVASVSHAEDCGPRAAGAYVLTVSQDAGATQGTVRVVPSFADDAGG